MLSSCGRAPVPVASYIDTKACRGCHVAVYDSYQKVGMARAFAPAADAPAGRYSHAASKREYEVIVRDGRVIQRRLGENAFELEATHAVGSGNHARTFLHRNAGGEFIELPLTWYSDGKQWAMSPGFDVAQPPDFTRIVDDRCLFCHNGYPAADGKLATGIDCQRCHGPGGRHVELAASGKPRAEVAGAIVNPAKLDTERQLDVCMQCHLETTSAELPAMVRRFGRPVNSYRPGERLTDYAVQFDDDRKEKFEVVNQAYRMRQSACFQKSGGKMTCTTCHNPHDFRNRGETCRNCHATVKAAGHPPLETGGCAGCHMPKRPTEDAPRVVMTDHKVQRRLIKSGERRAGMPALYYPATLPDADVYLGVAMITGRHGGIDLLERHAAELPGQALAVLGEGYLREQRPDKAIDALTRAIGKEPALLHARYNLAQALEAAGRLDEARAEFAKVSPAFPESEYAWGNLLRKSGDIAGAEAHYRQAIAMRPTYAEAHGNLGSLLADQGKTMEARAALERSLQIQPALSDAHNNLGRVLAAQGALPAAISAFRRALELNPKDVRARYNLARVLQETNATQAALAEYRRALQLDGNFVEARLALGQLLGDIGRIDAAIAEFREVLRLRPGHAEAQRSLTLALQIKSRGGR